MWDSRSDAWVRKLFENWRAQQNWQRLESNEKFAEIIEQHWIGIAAYCDPRNKVSLVFVEGLTNNIRFIQRRACVLHDEEYLKLKFINCVRPMVMITSRRLKKIPWFGQITHYPRHNRSAPMRGTDSKQEGMFSYVAPQVRVPTNHPLRLIQAIVSEAFEQMDRRVDKLYSQTGRPSIAPEWFVRTLLLQVLYSMRWGPMLIEQLEYNLMLRWFVGLSVDEPAWGYSTFSKNPDRLFGVDGACELCYAIVEQARMAGLLSDEHFNVDGSMIGHWIRTREPGPRMDRMDLRGLVRTMRCGTATGDQRTNDMHASTTHPLARLYKKSRGTPAKLAYLWHAVTESYQRLIVAVEVTQADGTAERGAAVQMPTDLLTWGTNTGYGTRSSISEVRNLNANPHVSQRVARSGGSAIGDRRSHHAGYALSIKARKLIEESFGRGEGHRTVEVTESAQPKQDGESAAADLLRVQPRADAQPHGGRIYVERSTPCARSRVNRWR